VNKLLGGKGLSQWISSAMVDTIPLVNMTVHCHLFLLPLSLFCLFADDQGHEELSRNEESRL
jgi:hypothetical protein